MFQEPDEVESLAREIHTLYQKESERLGFPAIIDYTNASESAKEFDRVLARFVIDKVHPKQDNKSRVGMLVFDESTVAKEYGSNMLGCEEIVRKEGDTIGIGNDDGGFIYLKFNEALALANWIKDKCK